MVPKFAYPIYDLGRNGMLPLRSRAPWCAARRRFQSDDCSGGERPSTTQRWEAAIDPSDNVLSAAPQYDIHMDAWKTGNVIRFSETPDLRGLIHNYLKYVWAEPKQCFKCSKARLPDNDDRSFRWMCTNPNCGYVDRGAMAAAGVNRTISGMK